MIPLYNWNQERKPHNSIGEEVGNFPMYFKILHTEIFLYEIFLLIFFLKSHFLSGGKKNDQAGIIQVEKAVWKLLLQVVSLKESCHKKQHLCN